MTRPGHNFPSPSELPIPKDIQPDDSWTERMLEMAEHIGAYRTLLLVDRFGGQRIYFPADYTRGKTYMGVGSIRDVVGDEAARILSRVYCREFFLVPTARHVLAKARRRDIIAAVRRGDMTGADAARTIKTARPYMAFLVNQTEEAKEGGEVPRPSGRRDGSQPDLFGDDEA